MIKNNADIVNKIQRLVAERQDLLQKQAALLITIEELKVELHQLKENKNNKVDYSNNIKLEESRRSQSTNGSITDMTIKEGDEIVEINHRIDQVIEEIDQCIEIISKNQYD
jgi:hypothetical protein